MTSTLLTVKTVDGGQVDGLGAFDSEVFLSDKPSMPDWKARDYLEVISGTSFRILELEEINGDALRLSSFFQQVFNNHVFFVHPAFLLIN